MGQPSAKVPFPSNVRRWAVVSHTRTSCAACSLIINNMRRKHACKTTHGTVGPRGWGMDVLLRDLGLALRMLRKNLRFSALVVAIVSVGIGAGATILSVVEAALIRGWGNSDRIAAVRAFFPSKNLRGFRWSVPELNELRATNRVFARIGAIGGYDATLIVDHLPEHTDGTTITSDIMPMLGTQPILGRAFTAADDRPGAPLTVMLGYPLWQRRFRGDPHVLGQSIRLNDQSYTVIGVMPEHYDLWGGEFWIPYQLNPADPDRSNRRLWILTELREGVTPAQGNQAVAESARQLERDHAGTNPEYVGMTMNLWNIKEAVTAGVRPSLLVLLGAVTLLLLIACGNLGSLLLVRAAGRQREMAIRTALGASRLRIIRQLLTESTLLAAIGGGLGLVLAAWGIPVVVAMVPWDLLPNSDTTRLDALPALVSAAVAMLVGIFIGLAPALFSVRRDIIAAIKSGSTQAGRSREMRWTHSAFIVSEIALAVVVLAGAGLMVRTYRELLSLDIGFRPQNVVTLRMSLPGSRYPTEDKVAVFYRDLLPRIAAQPGIDGVAAVTGRPMVDRTVDLASQDFQIVGRRDDKNAANANFRVITPEYFRVAGMRMSRGRQFNQADDLDHPLVVIINQTMAHMFWPSADPIGQRILLGNNVDRFNGGGDAAQGNWVTVVGVVADAKQIRVIDAPVRQEMFFPLAQRPGRCWSATLVMRSRLPKEATAEAVRRAVLAIDPEEPISEVYTMEQVVADSFGPKRLTTSLLGFFAFLAVGLASVGLYALIAYSVAQRTREFGIRMALGARRGHILELVLSESTRLVAIGVAAGMAAALGTTQILKGMLYNVSATDPLTFAAVAMLLAAVALLASYAPARRATRVEPMTALRQE